MVENTAGKNVSRAQAVEAQSKLEEQFEGNPSVSFGLTRDPNERDNWYILASKKDPHIIFPSEVEGVKVTAQYLGPIRALVK